MKRKLVRLLQRSVINPIVRRAAGGAHSRYALLETVGRKSGSPRVTPVANGLSGNTFWIVAEHGRGAGYVRNLESQPKVRVKVGGRWHSGTAHVLPDDDAQARLLAIDPRTAREIRLMGTRLLTVRIDLDPEGVEAEGR